MLDRYSWFCLILISPIFMQIQFQEERKSISTRSPCHELWWMLLNVQRTRNTWYLNISTKFYKSFLSLFLRRTSSKIINSSIVFPRFILQNYCYDCCSNDYYSNKNIQMKQIIRKVHSWDWKVKNIRIKVYGKWLKIKIRTKGKVGLNKKISKTYI